MTAALRRNSTAVAQKVEAGPMVAIRTPPSAGPATNAPPQTASLIPFALARGTPAARADSGIMASRAPAPAGSNTAPRTASATSTG